MVALMAVNNATDDERVLSLLRTGTPTNFDSRTHWPHCKPVTVVEMDAHRFVAGSWPSYT